MVIMMLQAHAFMHFNCYAIRISILLKWMKITKMWTMWEWSYFILSLHSGLKCSLNVRPFIPADADCCPSVHYDLTRCWPLLCSGPRCVLCSAESLSLQSLSVWSAVESNGLQGRIETVVSPLAESSSAENKMREHDAIWNDFPQHS